MKAYQFVFDAKQDMEKDANTPSQLKKEDYPPSAPTNVKQIFLQPREIIVESMHERFINKIIDLIEINISKPSLCVGMLAHESSMSNVQVYRKLKALTGRTPNELIRDFRLVRAHSLLIQQNGTIAEIAYQVGFNNLSYFTKCFKLKYGKCPSELFQENMTFKKLTILSH